MEPMPPNTAAVKALMPGMEPVVGISEVEKEQYITPATAASAEPMAKVREMVWLTLMPISWAAPLSSEHALMALPILLLPGEERQGGHDDQAHQHRGDGDVGDAQPAAKELHGAADDGRIGLGIRPPEELGGVLQEVADADGRYQHGRLGAARSGR